MLRRRSKAVGGKQGLMSDPYSLSSSSGNSHNKPTASSLFPSPSLFRSFSSKSFSDHEAAMMSPTSILETKHLSSFGNLLHSDTLPKNPPLENASAAATDTVTESKHHPWDSSGQEPIGLGIVDALTDDKAMQSSNPQRRMVLFGSQLKIQIPSVCSSSGSPPARSMELPSSPIEFGIKNKDSQLALFSPVLRSLGHEAPAASSSPWAFTTGSISVSEMELSEDYTCVISHGPNPKTTHIFDNCIVESCGDEFTAVMESSPLPSHEGYSADDFLCCACKKNLGEEMDIPVNRFLWSCLGSSSLRIHSCNRQPDQTRNTFLHDATILQNSLMNLFDQLLCKKSQCRLPTERDVLIPCHFHNQDQTPVLNFVEMWLLSKAVHAWGRHVSCGCCWGPPIPL